MTVAWVLTILVLLLLALGISEAFIHRRNLRKIPLRIHVNGTRGKSSVTRLIAAGMRESGIVTCAKTTGALPRMILPDGSEYPIYRPSVPNVIEQVRILSKALSFEAKAIVFECMAVQPYLQWLSEDKLIRATHTVITNAREDHLDVMGPTERDVALALAGSVPRSGKAFTTEKKLLDIFLSAAKDRRSELIAVDEEEIARVSQEEISRFSYVEHQENVALALRVCLDLGIDRESALRGMWKASPDPGAMMSSEINFFGRKLYFVNGFAANDPQSTRSLWQYAVEKFPHVDKRIAIFNCREDRPDRSRQLGEACVDWPLADHYVLIGSGIYIFAKSAKSRGLDLMKIVLAADRSVEEIFEMVVDLAGRSALVMGMGNIGGLGLEVSRYFRNRSLLKECA